MKQNPNYILKYLKGVPYLLPYGQMIADHYRGTKINSTGVYLWELLEKDLTLEEVLTSAYAYFEPNPDDKSTFDRDITDFLNTLLSWRILLENAEKPEDTEDKKYLTIAGLHMKLAGFGAYLPAELSDFLTDAPARADMTIQLHAGMPTYNQNGRVLIRNPELHVMELSDKYILRLPQSPEILEMHIQKDGTHTAIYSMPVATLEYKEKLFHALRLPFLYLAQLHGMTAIHSASILYENRAWLFSAPSGTGKSTHADLWHQYADAWIINGDLNLLALDNDMPVIHGIPWCGTSGIYDTGTYALGGIILLRQAPDDSIRALPPDEQQLLISQRFISPSWTAELFTKNLMLAEQIADKSLICRLYCTKEKSAWETMKNRIDKYLEGN